MPERIHLLELPDADVGRMYKTYRVWKACKEVEIACAMQEVDRLIEELRNGPVPSGCSKPDSVTEGR